MKHRCPPWKSPGRLLWFALALGGACWLALHMPHAHSGQLSARLFFFGRLFTIVGIAAFLGGLLEARHWHLLLVRFMGRLTRMARLPEIVGVAMPTALCSNAAANGILVSSHAEGHIRSSALIAGGMANSYLAYVSHSIRVMYPVIGAVGLPAALYFATQFTGGLLVILGVLCWNRWYVTHKETSGSVAEETLGSVVAEETSGSVITKDETSGVVAAKTDGAATAAPVDQPASPHTAQSAIRGRRPLNQPLPWPAALRTAWTRTATLLFRMVCLTVPLMLGIEWLLKNGAFNFWEQSVPEQVTRFFPAELVSVVAAQMGGLVQSASVAANLRTAGLIDNAQILLAMLVGSAVGNPFRTVRRNLPSALGIFSPSVALTIVLGMQFSRLISTVIASVLVVAFMHYVLY